MRFALINDRPVEASFGMKATCRGCGEIVIAKCGAVRVHHWSHLGRKMCDDWWEPETTWHRAWKDNFPVSWQETFMSDPFTGERHIADVRTDHGLVIEFQHSHLKEQEREARESFYPNMVWVVDGTRLKYDYPRFLKARKGFRETGINGIFRIGSPSESFPFEWINSGVPVIFDFLGTELAEGPKDIRNYLYCLLPIEIGYAGYLAQLPRKAFIKTAINGQWSIRISYFMDYLRQIQQIWVDRAEIVPLRRKKHESKMRRAFGRLSFRRNRL